jgi:hypothetical protein
MRLVLPTALLFLTPVLLSAQITRENYYRHVPPMPKLVAQTNASERLFLYGDQRSSEYRDANANGIDDQREQTLHRIAVRFSPILRRNNFSFPRNFKRVLGSDDVLHVDVWRAGQLQGSSQVRLGWSEAGNKSSGSFDVALDSITRRHDPAAAEPRYVKPNVYEDTVMFVDFPGKNPVTWRLAYRDADQREATVYTHFFIHEDTVASERRYQLVVQHWFFYPFNDSGNNHEGDWEHINVMVTTGAAAQADAHGHLTESEVAAIIDDERSDVDSLIIAAVDYYFHESVVTLDYIAARNTKAKPESWLTRLSIWADSSYIANAVRTRMTAADGALATHPIGHIGGNNKGPDELTSWKPRLAGGAYNRNGHGTYPFPGTWQSVGALSSTEGLPGDFLPRLSGANGPLTEIIADSQFVVFADSNIILIPDWERVQPLLLNNPAAQRDWLWLVLPMRWGFPVSKSPGGGAVPHTDLGNIAPESPPYQVTWNRVGTAVGWRRYDPHVVRVALAPTAPWDRLRNGVGLLNWPLGILGFMPGWNVAITQAMPWVTSALGLLGVEPPRTFRPGNEHFRFSSMTAGIQRQFGGDEFARMLPPDTSSLYQREFQSSDLAIAESDRRQASANAIHLSLQLHYGPRLSTENTLSFGTRELSAAVHDGRGRSLGGVTGKVDVKDLTGGFRYAFARTPGGSLQLYARAGWGWAWYTVHNVVIGGNVVDYKRDGGYTASLLPTRRWWPNQWYGGGGVEFFERPRIHGLPLLGYGIRLEVNSSRHGLDATQPFRPNLGMVTRHDAAISAVVGW